MIEIDNPNARRAREYRAVEKIALRNVRTRLDALTAEDHPQRKAFRQVMAITAAKMSTTNYLPNRFYA